MPLEKAMHSESDLQAPRYGELAAVVLAGAGHVLAELWLSEAVALVFSAAAAVAFLGYLVWRAAKTVGMLRAWGLRGDNFWPALRVQLVFALIGGAAIVGIGSLLGPLSLPATLWITLGLYPLWGTAQQFALQNLIARNLTGVFSNPVTIAVAASTLFGLSHYPRLDLLLLTLAAGVFFTLIYRRYPNLWAVGIAHGILGSLAVYLIAGEDPGAEILRAALGG